MKKLFIFLMILISTSVALWWISEDPEQELLACGTKALEKVGVTGITINAQGRIKNPIISGQIANKALKNKILNALKSDCQIHQYEDFIEIYDTTVADASWVNFSIDNVNGIINVSGQLNRQSELDAILQSLSVQDKQVLHSLGIKKTVAVIDYAENITLLLPSIKDIQLADVTLKPQEIILKGLVRDKMTETQVVSQLKSIFNSELIINNQLETVVKNDVEFERPDIKFNPLPPLTQDVDQ